MTAPNESSTTNAGFTAESNGEASLSDRVKGLRLTTGTSVPKSGGSGWLPWVLCLLMAVTWASFGIRAYSTGGFKALLGGSSSTANTTTAPEGGAKKEKVSSMAAMAPDEMILEVKGYLVAAQQIQVSPDRVSGKITKLNIVEGKKFNKGDALAEVDMLDYESDLAQSVAARKMLQAQLAEMKNGSRQEEKDQAWAQLLEAQAFLDQAVMDLCRMEHLVKNDRLTAFEKRNLTFPRPNREDRKQWVLAELARAKADIERIKSIPLSGQSITDKELIQAVADAGTKAARLAQMLNNWWLVEIGPRQEKIDSMEAQLDQAMAREKLAKEMLDRCTIRAPVSGIILSKRTEIGNLVNPLAMNTNFNGGICEMADLTDLEVDLEVNERDIRKVMLGYHCVCRADAYPERRYDAWVDRIMPVANSSKAIIPIRVKVRVPRSEEGKFLKPQMGAVVNFYNRKAEIPAQPKDPVIEQ